MKSLDLNNLDNFKLLSNFHEGVVVSDINGVIRFYNLAQSKIDDTEPNDALNKRIVDVYQVTEETSPTLRCLHTGRALLNETMVYRTRLGKVANIISNVYPLHEDGELTGAINFSKDYLFLEKMVIQESKLARKTRSNSAQYRFSHIIGSNPDIREAVRLAKMSANSPSPIMICGETGTGKELFAQSIHNHSQRAKKPFIPVNCAAIPENLLEGILFGTSKGAFTGALEKSGLFELANGGSVFLDELDSLPQELQAKLLRVVQEKKIRKLGSLKEMDLDIKIISSVGRPPLEIIQKGILRMDLFYRMGVVFIMVPPLRERRDDLNLLINHFIKEYNQALGISVDDISPHLQKLFFEYHWPGNVRELKHVIEASMNLISGGKIIKNEHLPAHFFHFTQKQHLGPEIINTADQGESEVFFQQASNLVQNQLIGEKQMICNALTETQGNAAKAARILGISPQSLQYKLRKHKINKKGFSPKIEF